MTANRRHWSQRVGLGALLIAVALFGVSPAHGQFLQLPVAIQNAHILTMDGRVISDGTLLIKGEKIAAVGAGIDVPLLASRINAGGDWITPGLIDANSSLGRRQSTAGSARATRRAEDIFDRYATRDMVEAIRSGVTAIYLSPGASPGISGTGAVVRLSPGRKQASFGQVLKSQAALCIDLASASKSITRLKTFQTVEKAFRDALQYRESLEDYEEKLSEYATKLKETAAKKTDEKGPDPKSPKPSAAEDKENDAEPEANGDAAKEDKKSADDKPKKPQRPARNPTAEILLSAIDGEMPVRVSAYRSADIFNAIDLANQFSLEIILENASEAHLVADAIADAEIRVVLGRMDYAAASHDDLYRRAIPGPGAALDRAGVAWIAGSGDDHDGARTRFVSMNAQLAAGRALSTDPLRIVTAAAADTLRVADKIGRLRPGLLADFVVWSGDPLDPASEVRQVYIGGTLVFDAAKEAEKGGPQ